MKLIAAQALAGMAVVTAGLMFSAPAFAVPSPGVSDVVNWYAGGALFERTTLYEDGSVHVYEPGFADYTLPGNGTETAGIGSCEGCNVVAIGLLEPGSTKANPIIGDMFTSLPFGTDNTAFTFTSVESGSIPIPDGLPNGGLVLLDETSGPIEIANYIFGSDNTYDSITIQSDVPEPASWAMLLAGLSGMGAMFAAQRRSSKIA